MTQDYSVKVKRVTILTDKGADEICITPDEAESKTAYPICGYKTTIKTSDRPFCGEGKFSGETNK